MSERVATCRAPQELPAGTAPDLVHLLPLGDVVARDGRRWRLADPQRVIKASQRATDLPIDYEHQNDDPMRRTGNGAVPAAGWITDLFVREDGLWGPVEWTTRAREHIAAREYRYLSPVFNYDKASGDILKIKGAGLVHTPALQLTALARRQETPVSDLSRIATALDLGEDADADAILTALARRQAPDPAKFVPIGAVRDLMTDRNQKLALLSDAEAAAKVDRAVEDGRITPAMRDWSTALCRQDPRSFDAFLSATPPVFAYLSTRQDAQFQGKPGGRVGPRGDGATAICAQLGLTPEQLAD